VERLGVVALGEGDDLLARDLVAAERIGLADGDVLELSHGPFSVADRIKLGARNHRTASLESAGRPPRKRAN
jgi:hypothetical protein